MAGDKKKLFEEAKKRWEEAFSASKLRDSDFETMSGIPLEPLYMPEGEPSDDYMEKIGFPGEYPYTRGVHASMYRSRLWTMRMFAGFGSAKDTNERFKFLLGKGNTGLSIAFDMPTLMGYDSDASLSLGEVGRCGVAISSLADMEVLFEGIPLDTVSVSMTINGPSIVLLAYYMIVAEKQGVPFDKLRGTLQNDILKEYIAQKEYIFPPRPSMRIITDMMKYCTEKMPLYNTISISGYHIREAGSTAAQELAFTLADGFAYADAAIEAGMNIDDFAPRLSFFFNSHSDFFEEIAKYRAARRIWARHMKERYKAKNERSWLMRFHTQTAGVSLTAQQPELNIARVALQALAGVLGGTQSLHTNSMDETLALPSARAAEIALRTQQIVAYESGVANTIDPLAGSYFVEALTDRLEKEAESYFERIEQLGGVIPAIEEGYFQREIARSAYEFQKKLESNRRIMVGVNDFINEDGDSAIPLLEIMTETENEQNESINRMRESRDEARVKKALSSLNRAAVAEENIMPHVLEAARSYATLGEIIICLKEAMGVYIEPAIF
ncbi:MAG: methylmalonyl-CoA mutase family protein [Candidatus Marinimicrobia bacterium]|nr:methylmalonyl-CoA mutase family protein [Candidatus Neomarinimicrobiota bacterium]